VSPMFTPDEAAAILSTLGGTASGMAQADGWPGTLTVAQLIGQLSALPQDAKVGGLFDSEMGWGPVTGARPGGGPQWKQDDPGWVTIIVDNQ
jgi:hypothetical protein